MWDTESLFNQADSPCKDIRKASLWLFCMHCTPLYFLAELSNNGNKKRERGKARCTLVKSHYFPCGTKGKCTTFQTKSTPNTSWSSSFTNYMVLICILLFQTDCVKFSLETSPLLRRRWERENHPSNNEVKEEDGIYHQSFAIRRLAIC